MAIDVEGSLVDKNGRVRHFGRSAFTSLAADLNRCFVCGIHNSDSPFNDEHVVPDWMLRRFGLHSRFVTMPYGRQMKYGAYTLRCCQDCNRLLGEKLEAPISELFSGGYDGFIRKMDSVPSTPLYQWLCLVFVKLHLKDREVRADADLRKDAPNLGEFYDWEGLHHIHTVARAAQSKARVEERVVGSILVFAMKGNDAEPFDFGDLSDYSTICVRIGEIGIASVLNDCGQVARMVHDHFSKISAPLNAIQLREVAARLAYGNELLLSRPRLWSELQKEDLLTIRAQIPQEIQHGEVDRSKLGALMAYACGPVLLKSKTPNAEEKVRQLSRGEIQFLYHDDGSFIAD